MLVTEKETVVRKKVPLLWFMKELVKKHSIDIQRQ